MKLLEKKLREDVTKLSAGQLAVSLYCAEISSDWDAYARAVLIEEYRNEQRRRVQTVSRKVFK